MCSQSRHCTIHRLEEPKTIGTGFVVYPIGINLFDGSEGCSIFNYCFSGGYKDASNIIIVHGIYFFKETLKQGSAIINTADILGIAEICCCLVIKVKKVAVVCSYHCA